jgi:GNAT superfamily N-acetyltransferase
MYSVTTDRARLDLDLIHGWLSRESYWAAGIPRALVERSLEHSLCFGLLHGETQIGFARVVTDYATFAYLADVFVLPTRRGLGLSKLLLQAIREHPSLQDVRRWSLVTRDAHRLYEQFGFAPLANPQRHMELVRSNPYASGESLQEPLGK